MTRLDYFLLFVLMATVAAVAPSSPLTRIIAGSGVTVVTNSATSFTLSATGGTTNTLIATNGAFIITNSAGNWTIGGTNSLAAGSGITITTNAANSWTVATTQPAGIRPIVVDTAEASASGGTTNVLQTNWLSQAYMATNGDSISFSYESSVANAFSIKGWILKFGGETIFNESIGEASGEGAVWTLHGTITRAGEQAQKSAVTFNWGVPSYAAVQMLKLSSNAVTTSNGFALVLEAYEPVTKLTGRIYYEPAP